MESEYFKRARESAGLTMDALAQAAGVLRVTIWHVEHRKRIPKPAALRSIAAALGLPESQLYLWLAHSPEFVDTSAREV